MNVHPATTASKDELRVLVVDDEVPFAGVVASYLEREGMSTSMAHAGPDAVTLARETDPDLVVLDIMLPGIDGIEVCRQLRTFTDAYVIMLTARDTEVDKVIALSVGADDYMGYQRDTAETGRRDYLGVARTEAWGVCRWLPSRGLKASGGVVAAAMS